MDDQKQKKWFLRKEMYGVIISSITPILLLFPQQTVAFKVGVSLDALAGGILFYLGITKGNKAKNLYFQENSNVQLPEGLRKK